jgi:predicted PurR-regulated permease PerM
MGLSNYRNYLNYLGGDKLAPYFDTVKRSVLSYLFVKTVVSVIVGVLTYLICLTFGVKFSFTWAFITFILNFVPNVGAIASTVLPGLMHLIQYGSIKMMLFLILSLVAVHNIMGNLIEPKWLGSNLRLNTVMVLFGLVFWGYIWGVPGMMISVPLMVILKLIFEFNPSTEIFARLMSYPENNDED